MKVTGRDGLWTKDVTSAALPKLVWLIMLLTRIRKPIAEGWKKLQGDLFEEAYNHILYQDPWNTGGWDAFSPEPGCPTKSFTWYKSWPGWESKQIYRKFHYFGRGNGLPDNHTRNVPFDRSVEPQVSCLEQNQQGTRCGRFHGTANSIPSPSSRELITTGRSAFYGTQGGSACENRFLLLPLPGRESLHSAKRKKRTIVHPWLMWWVDAYSNDCWKKILMIFSRNSGVLRQRMMYSVCEEECGRGWMPSSSSLRKNSSAATPGNCSSLAWFRGSCGKTSQRAHQPERKEQSQGLFWYGHRNRVFGIGGQKMEGPGFWKPAGNCLEVQDVPGNIIGQFAWSRWGKANF